MIEKQSLGSLKADKCAENEKRRQEVEGQNYVTDSVRYRLQHQPLDVVGCGVRN